MVRLNRTYVPIVVGVLVLLQSVLLHGCSDGEGVPC